MRKSHLVRFFKNEGHAEDFLEGNISMNFLGAYWGLDMEKLQEEKKKKHWKTKQIDPPQYGRDDWFEGVVTLLAEKSDILPDPFQSMNLGNVAIRLEDYRYCNLLCMCAVDYDDEERKINLPDTNYFKENFGESVVVIWDTNEFLRRLDERLSTLSYKYIYGRINYIDMVGDLTLTRRHSLQISSEVLTQGLSEAIEGGHLTDVFDKDRLLRNQREWRLCLHRGIREEERYCLRLSRPLSDIAELILTDDLNSVLYRQHPGYIYSMVQPDQNVPYGGNISRSDLQEAMEESGRYKILFSVG